MRFQINQKVVSVVDGDYLQKGKVYTVAGHSKCACCGNTGVLITLKICTVLQDINCRKCLTLSKDVVSFNSDCFRPVNYNDSAIGELLKEIVVEGKYVAIEEIISN